MLEKERYVLNSVSIAFPKHPDVRRRANDFEDKLKARLEGHYSQPEVIPVPDELNEQIPRIIFGSKHGFSQILISQVNLIFNVSYSTDWQEDAQKCKQYLRERLPVLFELLEILGDTKPFFCGLTTKARLASKDEDSEILAHFAGAFLKNMYTQDTYDVELKAAHVMDSRFFSNVLVQNYRVWKLAEGQQFRPLPRKSAVERGIEVIGDFNDRYSFNERNDYWSDASVALEILDMGFNEVDKMVRELRGSST